jgi:hypothetical protein
VPSTAAVAEGIIIVAAAKVVVASVGITLLKHHSLNPFLETSKYMQCQVKVHLVHTFDSPSICVLYQIYIGLVLS